MSVCEHDASRPGAGGIASRETVEAKPFMLMVSGAQGSGKSTLVKALVSRFGKQMPAAPQMREIVGAAFPGSGLASLSPLETFSAFMLRALGRHEVPTGRGLFVSDGSLLNDLAYLRGRLEVGAFGEGSRLNDMVFERLARLFEEHVRRYFAQLDSYLFVHLDPELPLENDGYRPRYFPFRDFVNSFLLQSYQRLGLAFVSVSGSVAERVTQVEDVLIEKTILRNP